MDDKKNQQEKLFLQSRELCIDTIEDELRLSDTNTLDMSQYSILGDATYNLDYMSKIDMSTHKDVINNSEYMKRYYENHRQTGKMKAYTDIGYMYLYEASEHYLTSTEPFMSIDEYCVIVADTVKTYYGIDMVEETRQCRRSLPIQNKFVFSLPDDKYLILTRGKLSAYNFTIFAPVYNTANYGLFRFIDRYIRSTIELVNLKSLRKKIKIKRIKKR